VRTSRAKTRRRSSGQIEHDERERAELVGSTGELGASGPQEGEEDPCGEALDEGEPVEGAGRRAVTPMAFEPVEKHRIVIGRLIVVRSYSESWSKSRIVLR